MYYNNGDLYYEGDYSNEGKNGQVKNILDQNWYMKENLKMIIGGMEKGKNIKVWN